MVYLVTGSRTGSRTDQYISEINRDKENEALILYLKQQGAFTGLEIKHLAACKIQSGF